MTSASTHQYACTKCFNWFEFEQLTKDSQLCQECSKDNTEAGQVLNGKKEQKKSSSTSRRTLRCKFCRTELQGSDQIRAHLCERCAKNKAEYGEPRNCALCNLPAAFIGSKCRRCATSVKKYGPPKQCQQCQVKAAFQHPKAQLGGRNLCWLCASTAQKAMKRVKRKASEEERAHRAKMSKTILSYSGSGGSPTELVIEEEIIQEKDSDWDDFHDMDYRLPPSLIESAPEIEAIQAEVTKTPPLEPVTKKYQTPSPDPAGKSDKTNYFHRMGDNSKNGRTKIKTEPDAVSNTEIRKMNPKLSRRSAPPLLKSKNHKHVATSASTNHKADLAASTSKLLDAKILRLQKKLSHKKGIDTFSSSPKTSKSGTSPPKNGGKVKDTSAPAPSKVTEAGPGSISSFKITDTGPSSLSAFKITDSTPSTSLTLERFKTSDSASSSPLPVVNDGNIVLVSQLRAEISSLKKQLGKKDQEMLEKDKQISCIKVEHLREQRDLRAKMKELIAKHAETLEQLKTRNQELLKKISQLSKGRA